MAEILVKATDAVHPDPDIDRAGCYKRGMPVVVMPDGHVWGSAEGPPTFVIIKVPGVSVEAMRKYIDAQMDETADPENPVTYRRRLWKIQLDTLPQKATDALASNGKASVKALEVLDGVFDMLWSDLKPNMINQKTGLAETEDLV